MDALRPYQKAWIEAALDEGVPLESLLVVEWGFGGDAEMPLGSTLDEVIHGYSIPGLGSGMPSPREGMSVATPVSEAFSDPEPQGASVTINYGKPITSSRCVKLNTGADVPSLGSGEVEMRIKNGGGEPWTEWRTYAPRVDWKLSEGEGQKVVHVQFRDRAGNKSEPAKATITLKPRDGSGFGSGESSIPTTRRASQAAPTPKKRHTLPPDTAHHPGLARAVLRGHFVRASADGAGGCLSAGGLVPQETSHLRRCARYGAKGAVGPGGADFLRVARTDRHDKSPAGLHGTPNRRDLLRGVNG
jgi:hypothetical protein